MENSNSISAKNNSINPSTRRLGKKNIKIAENDWDRRYIILGVVGCIGGLIYSLISGSLYQWGIINIYITSYYKIDDPSLTLEANAVVFPVMMLSYGITMRLGLYLAQKTQPLIIMLACNIFISLSVFISSFMSSIVSFIAFFGIVFGLFIGVNFMIPIMECNKYFPGKKMYVNGIILVGVGAGSIVFGQFSYAFLNPQKIRPLQGYYLGTQQLQEISLKVPQLLRYLSLLYLGVGLLGIFMMVPIFLSNKRKLKLTQNYQKNQNSQIIQHLGEKTQLLKKKVNFAIRPNQAYTLKEAFKSKVCWILVVQIMLASCGAYLINGNYKTYVKKTINDDQFLTLIGSLSAVGNGCSRFAWNIVFSKTGYKTAMLAIVLILITILSTIKFTVQIPQLYFLEVFLSNCCIGGILVCTATVGHVIFGLETGSNIYGFYWEALSTANFIQYIFVSNLSSSIGFDNIIYICLGMAVLSIPIIILTKFQGPWKNPTIQLQYCSKCSNQSNLQIQRAKQAKQAQKQYLKSGYSFVA